MWSGVVRGVHETANAGESIEVLGRVIVVDDTYAWRDVATRNGLRKGEIERMASAFEHDDLRAALA